MAERTALFAVAGTVLVGGVLAAAGPSRVAAWTFAPYALALLFGPSLVDPAWRHAGRSPARAALAALAAPLLWLAGEGFRVSAVFTPAETLFYALNPLSLGLFAFAALQMSVAELARRRLRRGEWDFRGLPGLVVVAVVVLAAAALLAGRGSGGHELFYGYVALYARIFG